ncbi:MAG: DMT family transporter [Bacillota bacterium]|nr:DMT family transporter [Bacillota bacterium]
MTKAKTIAGDLNRFEKRRLAMIMLFTATLIWGLTFLAQSEGAKFVPPLFFNAVRFWIGGFVVLPVAIFRATKNTGKLSFWYHVDNKALTLKGAFIDSLTLSFGVTFQQMGMATASPGKAGFLASLTIVFVAVIGLFFGKKLKALQWLGVFTAVFGVGIMSLTSDLSINIGEIYLIISAFIYAFNTILTGYYSTRVETFKYTTFRFFFAAATCTILSVIFESVSMEAIKSAVPTLLFTGIFSSGIAFTLQAFAQVHVEDLTTQLMLSLESVVAMLGQWIILGTVMSSREMIGAFILFGSVVFIQVYESYQSKKIDMGHPQSL